MRRELHIDKLSDEFGQYEILVRNAESGSARRRCIPGRASRTRTESLDHQLLEAERRPRSTSRPPPRSVRAPPSGAGSSSGAATDRAPGWAAMGPHPESI